MAQRIVVEWMTGVPIDPEVGESVYDAATWSAKGFRTMEAARKFAQKEAARNEWRHDATEIVEAT